MVSNNLISENSGGFEPENNPKKEVDKVTAECHNIRITFWGTEELKNLLKKASGISGLSVSYLLRTSAKEKALEILKKPEAP